MPKRFLAVVAILVMGFSLLPAQSVALPPSPQVDQWNEGPVPVRAVGESDADFQARIDAWIMRAINRLTWNCYNYGVNVQTVRNLGIAVRAHPGTGMAWPNLGAAITAADMCTKTRNRAINDGLHAVAWNGPRPGFPLGDPIPTPPVGENLVALGGFAGVKGNTADYHWWRLNGDGSWSHKRGGTPAKTTYTDNTVFPPVERPLTDPRDPAQRDGYELCGFMSVPKAGATIGPLAAAPVCTPNNGTVLVQAVAPSGLPDPQKNLTSSESNQLISHLPSFSPGNRISDPMWADQPAGIYEGWFVTTGVNGAGPIPPMMRAYQGAVEVVFAWPDTDGFKFYHDDHGLEAYLTQIVEGQPLVNCPDASHQLTECQCSDEALGDATTATLLALFRAEPVANGVELRWQFGDPQQFASSELERAESAIGPWSALGAQPRDDAGVMTVLDPSAEPGRTYFYRLVATTRDGRVMTFGPLSATAGVTISDFALAPLAPNPSLGPTQVDFALQRETQVRLSVFDVQGREVALLARGLYLPGHYQASWSGRTSRGETPAGLYFVRLQVPGRTLSRQLILTR